MVQDFMRFGSSWVFAGFIVFLISNSDTGALAVDNTSPSTDNLKEVSQARSPNG